MELARHLGQHFLSGGEVDGQVEGTDPDPLRPFGPQPHFDAFLIGVPARHMPESVDVEIGVEFPVDHREHIAIEPGRHSGGVVVGAHQPTGVLDQVGAQQQGVVGAHHLREGLEEFGTGSGCEVPDRRAEEHEQAPTAAGNLAEVLFEIATDSLDFDVRVLVLNGHRRGRQDVCIDVERDKPAQRSAIMQRVQKQTGLLRGAAAEFDQGVGLAG